MTLLALVVLGLLLSVVAVEGASRGRLQQNLGFGSCHDASNNEFDYILLTQKYGNVNQCADVCDDDTLPLAVGMSNSFQNCKCLFSNGDADGLTSNADYTVTNGNSGTGAVYLDSSGDGFCYKYNTHFPTTSPTPPTPQPTSSPSFSPSTAPSTSPTRAPTGAPSPPTPKPTATPSSSPTESCVEARIVTVIDRTYARNPRAQLEFGVNVIQDVIDGLQEAEVDFGRCVTMVFASLEHRNMVWMVDDQNLDSVNATALAAASRNAAWKSGYSHRSLPLNTIFGGAVEDFCAGGDANCYLVLLTDGNFRSVRSRTRTRRAFSRAQQVIGADRLRMTCIFPKRRFTHKYLARRMCDDKYYARNGGANRVRVASKFVNTVLGSLK